jgi:DNA-binding MarR family transcriptional regulator
MDLLLANKLAALAAVLDRGLTAAFEPLSPSSTAAILTLKYRQPLTATELSRIIGLSQPATVRLLERLLATGLVERAPLAGIKEVRLSLSREGETRAEELQRVRLSTSWALLEQLSPIERLALHGLIDKLVTVPVTDRQVARHLCRFCDHALCEGALCPIGCAATALDRKQGPT